MKLIKEEALTYDDVSLVPQYSNIKSRKDPDVSWQILEQKYSIPVIASPMNTVCEFSMAVSVSSMGGQSVIHRFMTIENQIAILNNFWQTDKVVPFFAIGATGDYLERFELLYGRGATRFCIDVANGDTEVALKAAKNIKSKNENITLMGGNTCTRRSI